MLSCSNTWLYGCAVLTSPLICPSLREHHKYLKFVFFMEHGAYIACVCSLWLSSFGEESCEMMFHDFTSTAIKYHNMQKQQQCVIICFMFLSWQQCICIQSPKGLTLPPALYYRRKSMFEIQTGPFLRNMCNFFQKRED